MHNQDVKESITENIIINIFNTKLESLPDP